MADTNPSEEKSVEPVEGDYICQCFQVTDTTIKAHIRSKNLDSIEGITEACGAGGGCQSCHMLLELFLDEHHKRGTFATNKPQEEKKKGFFSKLFSRA